MVEIKAWLQELALSEYEPAFRDHQITVDLLTDLSDDDLKLIGVSVLGARKRLLKAIAALPVTPLPPTTAPHASPTAADAPPAHTGPHPITQAAAERRHMTVMFVDMVGSTPLSTSLDPEDLAGVIAKFHATVRTEVERFGGFVARASGDGLLVYFGYPHAHEDDAERAVRAALGAMPALAALTGPGRRRLEARIALATGWVVLGDLAGTAQHEIAGEAPNLAARLLGIAAPGAIVACASTAHLLGERFALTDLGPQRLKGFGTDQRAVRIDAPRMFGRFEARIEQGLTELVGREADLALLLDRWERARAGEDQIALITGEAGIGKSRVVHSLQASLAGTPHLTLRWQCSAFHSGSALRPVIGQLELASGFTRNDTDAMRLAKLRHVLQRAGDADTDPFIALIADLLTIRLDSAAAFPPEERKVRLFAGLMEWLRGLARSAPLLLIVEDAHWIDPTTADLLDRVVEGVAGLPVMTLLTARSDYRPPAAWTRLDRFTHHVIHRLSRAQAGGMAETVAGAALPADLLQLIVEKTDGVPLFVEELTKSVVESNVLSRHGEQLVLIDPLPALAVPATLQNSLIARLDRLPAAKPIAQIGAALGRDFSHAQIEALAPADAGQLGASLDSLQSAGLIFQRGTGAGRSYAFKHALVRDAAYESLLRSQRTALHRRIAETMETRFPATAVAQPEILAHHWTEAGDTPRAVRWWREAGRRALSRLAFAEAIAHLDRALTLSSDLPPDEARDRLVAAMWLEFAMALRQTQWGSRAMEDAARRALRIGIDCNDPAIAGQALAAMAEVAAVRPDLALFRDVNRDLLRLELCLSGRVHTRRMIERAARPAAAGDREPRGEDWLWTAIDRVDQEEEAGLAPLAQTVLARSVQAGVATSSRTSMIWQFIGLEMFWRGRFAGLDAIFQRAIAQAAEGDPTFVGWHQHLLAKTWLGFSYAQMGYIDKGRLFARRSVVEADRSGELSHLVLALNAHNVFCYYCDDVDGARVCAARLEEVSFRYGVVWYQPAALLTQAWIATRSGPAAAAQDIWRRGREMLDSELFQTMRVGLPHLLVLSAQSAMAMGRKRDAMADVDRGLALIAETGEAHSESELHRLKGEIAVAMGDHVLAERCFRQALGCARHQSAKGLLLRAATSLGRLLVAQGRAEEMQTELMPVWRRFTEGFESPVLQQARRLLDRADDPVDPTEDTHSACAA
jgi:class 3 adenylate cyclase/tetratricopeptide (TPR) repeat protein